MINCIIMNLMEFFPVNESRTADNLDDRMDQNVDEDADRSSNCTVDNDDDSGHFTKCKLGY